MTMSDGDVARLFHEIEELRKEIQNMIRNGCAKAPEHADHEARIRSVESILARQAGAYTVVAVVASFGTALLFWIGNAVIRLMGARS